MKAFVFVADRDPITGAPTPIRHVEPLAGVRCELRNDKGSWSIMTPDDARVQRSSVPLEVQCTKEGYQPRRGSIWCSSPRQEASGARPGPKHDIASSPLIVLALPAAIVALPYVVVGVAATTVSTLAAPHDDLCSYKGVAAFMAPEGEWAGPSVLRQP